MASFDIYHEIDSLKSIVPAAYTNAGVTGASIDTKGYSAIVAHLVTGVITDGTHTLTLQESSDNSSFSNVALTDQLGAFTALTSSAGGSATQKVGYIGALRYLRVLSTVSGATTGGVYGCEIAAGHKRHDGKAV